MEKAKNVSAIKYDNKAPQNQEFIVDHKNITVGFRHIRAIENACRTVEARLRAEFQNPLAEILKYLNLAENRLPEQSIECAIRPFFYFGMDHSKISTQESFQNAVRELLDDAESIAIFNQMIRVCFQAFELRVDSKKSHRSVHAAIGPASLSRPIPHATVHCTYYWSKTGSSSIHIGQMIRWKGFNFFISYGRAHSKTADSFMNSVEKHMHLTHTEFTRVVERELITRFADPLDEFSRDNYLEHNFPDRRSIVERIASHILPNKVPPTTENFIKLAARQTTLLEFEALKVNTNTAYKTVARQELRYFNDISKSIPSASLQKHLFCDGSARQHLLELKQHPIQNLLLDKNTLKAIALPLNAPISAALNADLPTLPMSIIEVSWKAYVTEQRLVTILNNFRRNSLLGNAATLTLIFQLANIRFMNTKLIELPIDRQFLLYVLEYVDAYLDYTTIELPLEKIALTHLLNVPTHYDPIDFGGLPRITKAHFINALIQHLSEWRQIQFPASKPKQITSNTPDQTTQLFDFS